MSHRQKKSSFLTKGVRPVNHHGADPPSEPPDKVDRRDVVLKELLEDLLPLVCTDFQNNKSFVKIKFRNFNTYRGWIGPNGLSGFGTYEFSGGASYRGAFHNSLTKGLGRYTYRNGSTYEGELLAGLRHGYGRYKTKRFRYDGYFLNGLFHGQGVWKSKSEEQRGTFFEGKIAEGEVTDACGTFKGIFDQSGIRHLGKFTFRNGNTYRGNWADDLFWGFGVYNWVEENVMATRAETKYVGYWNQGQRYGLGMQTFRKRCVICQWYNDRKSGAGIIVACNGNVYAGTEIFTNNQYKASYRIKLCKESRGILLYIVKLTTPEISYENMEQKSAAFMQKIKELLGAHADWFSPIYPIRIPHHEIVSIPPGPYSSDKELKYLQQVMTENYRHFYRLYRKYIHPIDEYMNNLSLNLFYMDVLLKVQDVNVAESMREANILIRHQCSFSEAESCHEPLAPVPFYEFFQHFLVITEILMRNKELHNAAEKYRPTFFGHLAIQVLLVFKMITSQTDPDFLVREAIQANRPGIMTLLRTMTKQSPGDTTIRAAYRYLHEKGVVSGRSTYFIKAVGMYFDKVFQDGVLHETEFETSDLEKIEIVLRTTQLKLIKEDIHKDHHHE